MRGATHYAGRRAWHPCACVRACVRAEDDEIENVLRLEGVRLGLFIGMRLDMRSDIRSDEGHGMSRFIYFFKVPRCLACRDMLGMRTDVYPHVHRHAHTSMHRCVQKDACARTWV